MTLPAGNYRARRGDRLGVHSLDHFRFDVPDLAEARRFYEGFGLRVTNDGADLVVRTHGDDHAWIRIGQGARKRLDYVSFGVFADDLPRFQSRLDAFGLTWSAEGEDQLVFADPHGVTVRLHVATKVMPDEKLIAETVRPASADRSAAMRGETTEVRPRRLAHIMLFTPDIERSVAFYSEVLGLRISDFPGPVAFLHGAHGSDHHLIAFAGSPLGSGYHHSAWDVDSIDAVGLGAEQMREKGFDQGWGLGRHVLGSNYFHYVRDPWGSYAEYSYDIDFVPAAQDWPAGYPDAANSLYLWGPGVPSDFITNHEGLVGQGAAQ